ncbi:hypothetical protein KCP78_02230 [Salmonella enterica subsp. enterica]|nr:hypothetical protein KCP78_02230 [Salmonella enterica subsp. enterica]
MQRARCYLLGEETAVVWNLNRHYAGEPETHPASDAASGRYAERGGSHSGMNNITVIFGNRKPRRWMRLSVCSAGGERARRAGRDSRSVGSH